MVLDPSCSRSSLCKGLGEAAILLKRTLYDVECSANNTIGSEAKVVKRVMRLSSGLARLRP